MARRPQRGTTHQAGSAARQLAVLLRRLATHSVMAAASPEERTELHALLNRAVDATANPAGREILDSAVVDVARHLWPEPSGSAAAVQDQPSANSGS